MQRRLWLQQQRGRAALPGLHPQPVPLEVSEPQPSPRPRAQTGSSSPQCLGLGWCCVLPCPGETSVCKMSPPGTWPLSNEQKTRQLLNKTHLLLPLEYLLKAVSPISCGYFPGRHPLQALWMLSPLPAITVFACLFLFSSFSQSVLIVEWLILGFVF